MGVMGIVGRMGFDGGVGLQQAARFANLEFQTLVSVKWAISVILILKETHNWPHEPNYLSLEKVESMIARRQFESVQLVL